MNILYEDNHLIIINKAVGEIVQGDKTGDEPLPETIKRYLKEKYNKPGNVFCGVTHRLDRPVSGVVVFAKTSKALERINNMLKNHEIKKTYWAIVKNPPKQSEGTLVNYLVRNEKQNKSFNRREMARLIWLSFTPSAETAPPSSPPCPGSTITVMGTPSCTEKTDRASRFRFCIKIRETQAKMPQNRIVKKILRLRIRNITGNTSANRVLPELI